MNADTHALLGAGDWAVWRWVGLRSAGLPVATALGLASPACAAAADRCLAEAEGPARAELLRRLDTAIPDALRALHEAARLGLFREAVTWQNRYVLGTGVDVLLSRSPDGARSSKDRQKEALVTSYLQRYCTKNDTIGFFGPVGWARVADNGPPIEVRPGPAVVAQRTVYFEGWCVDALAAALAGDEALRPWLVPRRMPTVDVEGSTLHLPLTPPIQLSAADAAVLRACNGEQTARQLARDLVGAEAPGLATEQQLYEVLDRLRRSRRIVWTLEVPAEGLRPERTLRRQLDGIADERLRARCVAALAELEAARDAVAGAAGSPDRLEAAIEALERTFTRLTRRPPTRHEGRAYAGRTLVYEDCRRDVTVNLGSGLMETLEPPLSLLLASARWFTFEAAQLYRRAFRQAYDELAATTRASVQPFASWWMYAHPLLFGPASGLLSELERRLHERWAAVLNLTGSERRVVHTAESLREQVATAFAAPRAGWSGARVHSVDLLMAASGVEAIQRGDYRWVLGEVHPGGNTLRSAFFVAQHPAPGELMGALDGDFAEPEVLVVASRELGGVTLRMSNAMVRACDLRLVFAQDTCGVPASRALPIGALVIEEDGEGLVVRSRDGRLSFDVIELLGDLIMLRTLQRFDLGLPSRHGPRVTFDRLVVARERWRFEADELPFAWSRSEVDRLLGLRGWVRALDLPRFVFVRTSGERKPIYVDLESLLSIDVFARAVRRVRETADRSVTVVEMLPDPGLTWLTDAEGRRYTSELRLVVVDQSEARRRRPAAASPSTRGDWSR